MLKTRRLRKMAGIMSVSYTHLHSCHNVSRREFDEGVTYLQLMRQNAEHLKKGLE